MVTLRKVRSELLAILSLVSMSLTCSSLSARSTIEPANFRKDSQQIQLADIEKEQTQLTSFSELQGKPEYAKYLASTTSQQRAQFALDYIRWYFKHPSLGPEANDFSSVVSGTECKQFASAWWKGKGLSNLVNEDAKVVSAACLEAIDLWRSLEGKATTKNRYKLVDSLKRARLETQSKKTNENSLPDDFIFNSDDQGRGRVGDSFNAEERKLLGLYQAHDIMQVQMCVQEHEAQLMFIPKTDH